MVILQYVRIHYNNNNTRRKYFKCKILMNKMQERERIRRVTVITNSLNKNNTSKIIMWYYYLLLLQLCLSRQGLRTTKICLFLKNISKFVKITFIKIINILTKYLYDKANSQFGNYNPAAGCANDDVFDFFFFETIK